jgi:uncharacterized protein
VVTVTADTNVYISGLHFGGAPLRFLELARAGAFRLAVSDAVLDEIAGVLCGKFGWSAEQVDAALSELKPCSIFVRPTRAIVAIKDDPDDDRILECAIAANAAFIVTGDGDLLRMGQFETIEIIRVTDFLTRLPLLIAGS